VPANDEGPVVLTGSRAVIRRALGSKLLRAASIYTLGNSANAAVPLVLIPVLTRYLEPEAYGILAMYLVLFGICTPIAGAGLQSAVLRRYYDSTREELGDFVGNSLFLLVVATAVVGGLLYAAAAPIETLTGYPRSWFWAVLVAAFGKALLQIRLNLWRAQEKAVRFGLLQGAHTGLTLVAAIALVAWSGLGWQGAVLGYAGASMAAGAVGVASMAGDGWINGFRLKKAVMASLLRYGLPLIPHAVAGFSLVAIDRVFVSHFVGIAETGVYLVGAQLGMGLSMLFTSINAAYSPWLFNQLRQGEHWRRVRVIRLAVLSMPVALLFAGIVAALAGPLITLLAAPEYSGATVILRWLALASAFNGMYMAMVAYVFYSNRTGAVFIITGCAAILNIALNYYLVTHVGAVGAAQATAGAFALKFVLACYVSTKVCDIPWRAALRRTATAG
jgi:O-antigen/teichoic acid export membrane protein